MPQTSDNIIKLFKPITNEKVTYTYKIHDMLADNYETAVEVNAVYETMSGAVHHKITKAISDGVNIYWNKNTDPATPFYWSLNQNLRASLLSIAPNAKSLKPYTGVSITLDINDVSASTLRHILAHELSHHEWFDLNVNLLRKVNDSFDLDDQLIKYCTDPWGLKQTKYLSEPLPRSTLNCFFDDLRTYLSNNPDFEFYNYQSTRITVIFTGPLAYFSEQVKGHFSKQVNTVLLDKILFKNFYRFLQNPSYQPLVGIFRDINSHYPNIKLQKLRKVISLAASEARNEIPAFFGQIEEMHPGATLRLAPQTARLLEKIRSSTYAGVSRERVIHLGYQPNPLVVPIRTIRNNLSSTPYIESNALVGPRKIPSLAPVTRAIKNTRQDRSVNYLRKWTPITNSPRITDSSYLNPSYLFKCLKFVILPASFAMSVNTAFNADPNDPIGAVIEGGTNVAMKFGLNTLVSTLSLPAKIIFTVTVMHDPIKPEQLKVEMETNVNIGNKFIKDQIILNQVAIHHFIYALTQASHALFKKIDDLATAIRYTPPVKMISQVLNPLCAMGKAINEGHCLSIAKESNYASGFLPSFSYSTTHCAPLYPYSQSNNDVNLDISYHTTYSNEKFIPLTHHRITYSADDKTSHFAVEPKSFLSNLEFVAKGGLIGFSAKMTLQYGANATLQALIGKSGFLFNSTITMGEGFWSAFGASLGLGTLIAFPFYIAQRVYKNKINKVIRKIKSNHRISNNEAENWHNQYHAFINQMKDNAVSNDELLTQANTLLIYSEIHIKNEKKRYSKARHSPFKKSSRLHKKLLQELYQPTHQSLLSIQEHLKSAPLQEQLAIHIHSLQQMKTLGFHQKAAIVMEEIAKLNPELDTAEFRESISQLRLADQLQIGMAFARTLQAIIERHVAGMASSKIKMGIMTGLEGINLIQAIIPTAIMFPLQAAIAQHTGTSGQFNTFISQVTENLIFDLKNPLTISGGVLYGQVASQLMQSHIESALPTPFQARAHDIKSTLLSFAKPVLHAATAVQAGMDLWENKGKSATAPQSLLTIAQTAYTSASKVYESYRCSTGNAIEEVQYYYCSPIVNTVLETASHAMSIVRGREFFSPASIGFTLFGSANIIHSAKASSTHLQAAQRAIEACLSNLNHYYLLKNSQSTHCLFDSVIDTYLDNAQYCLINEETDFDINERIKHDRVIYIIKHPKPTIAFLNRSGEVDRFILPESMIDSLDGKLRFIIRQAIIANYKKMSLVNLRIILEHHFGGLEINDKQDAIINHAREVYHATMNNLGLIEDNNIQPPALKIDDIDTEYLSYSISRW